ncbi:MAG: Fe-only nitrogenase accessory AnfO family protein [Symbiopectobacterium sp.]|uniref:Fe-only nitrogenase accessory AnfO family protein n=1 Tax=Symbiopectobacterium sp. TaxID=2952789 RepID=UPI0039E9E176
MVFDTDMTPPLYIAAYLDNQGMITASGQPGVATLFVKARSGWQCCREVPYPSTSSMSLAALRQQTLTMLEVLPECRHIVAREIQGVLLAWLDGRGITMWRCSGKPVPLLDRIAERIHSSSQVTPLHTETFFQPGIQTGDFHFNLIDALANSGEGHISRRLLQPFLQQKQFRRLEVICDHLPKCFATLDAREFSIVSEPRADGTFCVVVMPQNV